MARMEIADVQVEAAFRTLRERGVALNGPISQGDMRAAIRSAIAPGAAGECRYRGECECTKPEDRAACRGWLSHT